MTILLLAALAFVYVLYGFVTASEYARESNACPIWTYLRLNPSGALRLVLFAPIVVWIIRVYYTLYYLLRRMA